jgi:hypothetical protein
MDSNSEQKQAVMDALYNIGLLLAQCSIDGEGVDAGCDGSFEILDALHELEEKCGYYLD